MLIWLYRVRESPADSNRKQDVAVMSCISSFGDNDGAVLAGSVRVQQALSGSGIQHESALPSEIAETNLERDVGGIRSIMPGPQSFLIGGSLEDICGQLSDARVWFIQFV